MVWARLLAYATGAINRELLLKNEYLVAEPDSENEGEGAVGPFRRRKNHARRDRSPARPQVFGGSGPAAQSEKLIARKFDGANQCFSHDKGSGSPSRCLRFLSYPWSTEITQDFVWQSDYFA
jgi:hypothetical protein